MNRFVIDTSVTVAWYFPEIFEKEARVWLDGLLEGRLGLTVPSLHYLEFANVLRTRVRRGIIDESQARDIFDLHLDAPLECSDPSRRSLLDTALTFSATAYDAVFISLALDLDLPLLTAERTTTPWVTRLGDRVRRLGLSGS